MLIHMFFHSEISYRSQLYHLIILSNVTINKLLSLILFCCSVQSAFHVRVEFYEIIQQPWFLLQCHLKLLWNSNKLIHFCLIFLHPLLQINLIILAIYSCATYVIFFAACYTLSLTLLLFRIIYMRVVTTVIFNYMIGCFAHHVDSHSSCCLILIYLFLFWLCFGIWLI